jgi:hypothetical protein
VKFWVDFARAFIYLGGGPAVVFYPAICASVLAFCLCFRNLREQTERRENCAPRPLRFRSAMDDKTTVIPPRDPWPFSTVTAKDLQALVAEGLLRPLYGGPQPKWLAPGSEADLTPPSGYVVSFTPFHERGFGMPVSRFMRALPHYYGVELHNFNPNSIAQAAIFAAVREGFLGIHPHWDLWTHLFSAEFFAVSTDVKKVRMAVRAGGCTLQLRSGAHSSTSLPPLCLRTRGGRTGGFTSRMTMGCYCPFLNEW